MDFNNLFYKLLLTAGAAHILYLNNPIASCAAILGILAFLGFSKYQEDKVNLAKMNKLEEIADLKKQQEEQLAEFKKQMEAFNLRMSSIDSKFALSNSRKMV